MEHPKRRREWLAGRIAAKTAIRLLLAPNAPELNNIVIETGEEGSPRVVLQAGAAAPPSITITHSHDLAAALATVRSGFGIDVEAIGPSVSEIESSFTAPEEAERVQKLVPGREAALTCLWVAKEACRKALGVNRVAIRDLTLDDIYSSDEYLVSVFLDPGARAVRCVMFAGERYAYAVAGPAQTP